LVYIEKQVIQCTTTCYSWVDHSC